MIKKIPKKDLATLLGQWGREYDIFCPSREGGEAALSPWDGKDAEFLEWYRNTTRPPKASFLPPLEEMFGFRRDGDGYLLEVPSADTKKRLLFGVRPCDARALAMLDMVFKDAYDDPYYLAKRENTVLVGMACTSPYDSCFCTSLGGGPAEAADVDLMMTDLGKELLLEAVTKKGEALLKSAPKLVETTAADKKKAAAQNKSLYNKVAKRIDAQGIDKKLEASFEDSEFWEGVAAKCISCGVCTLLCPTCYCFDINDELAGKQGQRLRSWDSCAFPVYTKMPMENPRQEKWRRVRQKVCHKYQFFPMGFDTIACTGCGRCIRLCPVNWDITQVLNALPVKA